MESWDGPSQPINIKVKLLFRIAEKPSILRFLASKIIKSDRLFDGKGKATLHPKPNLAHHPKMPYTGLPSEV
jgi:hypothetical protein